MSTTGLFRLVRAEGDDPLPAGDFCYWASEGLPPIRFTLEEPTSRDELRAAVDLSLEQGTDLTSALPPQGEEGAGHG